jgi:sigma-B regulation protein RsbU (phosphoserine phosphatase)
MDRIAQGTVFDWPRLHPEREPPAVPWQDSLRTRMMLWFGALVGVLLAVGFVAAFAIARQQIVSNAQARTRYEAAQAADRVGAAMASVRITGDGIIGLFNTLTPDREATARLLEAMLDADASAVGGLIALEPGVLPDGAPMGYYAGVARRGVADRDLLAAEYDVRAQPWYRRTLAADAPWWSEPYFNETAGGRWMTTLNMPLRGRDGARLGMVSLDVPVARWEELIEPLQRIPGQRPALFAPQGTIVLYPDTGIALKTTVARFINTHGRRDLLPLERARVARQRQEMTHTLPDGSETRSSVLEPIGDTGWSLQLALSHKAILADLKRTTSLLAAFALVALGLTTLAVRRMARRITNPLRDLTGSASHFAAGEFDYPLRQTERRDEVGVMARAFDNARGSIKRQMVEIQGMSAARQKLESELGIARDIQQAMLPGARQLGEDDWHLQAHAMLEPATAVGGDFYSFFERDRHTLWFAIGDVSDKGVPAALFMARTATVLEVAAGLGGSPEAALKKASWRLAQGNETCMFATVLCGLIDARTGELTLASAGHEPPVLLRADGRTEFVDLVNGPALGLEVNEHYTVWHGRLRSGDALVAYTDGITEALDADNQPFGTERLRTALRAGTDAATLCATLVADVHRFATGVPQSDDITALALRWTTAAPGATG